MNEQNMLWRACLENPGEDTPRLAFADMLEQQGFSELADEMRGAAGQLWLRSISGRAGDPLPALAFMSHDDRVNEVHSLVEEEMQELVHDEAITSLSAITNAAMWGIDEFDVENVWFAEDGCHASINFTISGDQIEDRTFMGDRISGTVEAVIGHDGEVSLTNLEADLVRDDEEGGWEE